jgi:uroporphyrinogen decarboxylase
MSKNRKPILEVLNGKVPERVPFWLMRQAGRYLPEYRDLRKTAGGFLDLVYDSEKAAEVTVQPIRRFGMDAAILFSDILVIPHALGQSVTFGAGEGPKLDRLMSENDFAKLDLSRVEEHCQPVFETVSRVRDKLCQEKFDETALIGFCGSPWTVICYMIEGQGSKDFEAARRWALHDPESFQKLVDIVTEASCIYLTGQIRAGAEAIQLFDSWSGLLDAGEFHKWVIAPTKKIRKYLKDNFPDIRIIGFPRGAGVLSTDYVKDTGVDCIGLDQTISPGWAVKNLQTLLPVQGNLDPIRLLCGGAALEEGLETIYKAFSGRPWIFNLGHGVIKETDISHIEKLRDITRGWKA